MEGYIFQGLSLSLFQSRYFLIQALLPALITSLYTCDRSDLCHQSSPKSYPLARCQQQSISSAATSTGDDVNYGDDAHPPTRLHLQLSFRLLRLARSPSVCALQYKLTPQVRLLLGLPGAQLQMERALVKASVRQGRWKCSSVHSRLCWQSATLELVPS